MDRLGKEFQTCMFCPSNPDTNLFRFPDGSCEYCPGVLTALTTGDEYECKCSTGQQLVRYFSMSEGKAYFKCEERDHYQWQNCDIVNFEDGENKGCLECPEGFYRELYDHDERGKGRCLPLGLTQENCEELGYSYNGPTCKKCAPGYALGPKNYCVKCEELGCKAGCSKVNLSFEYRCQRDYNCECLDNFSRVATGTCVDCSSISYAEVIDGECKCIEGFAFNYQ